MSETPETPRFVDQAKRYKLGSRIATGGMGEVWRAEDTVLNRTVAVKLLKNEYADDSSFRARFESEARNAAALHHPNVAAVFDFGEAPAADPSGAPRPYLVMELVDGRPLSDLIRPGNPMDPDAMRELLAQAADAIGAAHTAGIVHRDVKPANLLVTPDRRVKITDFGIARATEGMALTATGQVMGTPQYLSPEQAQGRGASPASDVYSLGVVAFECLAGRRPFEADSPVATALAHVREPVPDLPDDVPADLAAVVYKTMEKDPEARFPDGRELASALRDPATAATMIAGAGAGDGGRTSVLPGAAAGAGLGAAAGYAAGRGSQGDASPGTRGMDTQGAGAAGAAGGAGAAGSGAAPTDRDQRSSGSRAWLWALLAAAGVVIVILLVTQLTGGGDDDEPTPEPTRTPTQTETETETPTPTQEPAPQPTREPTTESPTEEPTTESPTEEPTTESPSTPTSPSSPATQPSSQDPTGTPTPDTAPSEDASPSVSQVGEEPDGSDEGTSAGSASRPVWHPSTGQGDR